MAKIGRHNINHMDNGNIAGGFGLIGVLWIALCLIIIVVGILIIYFIVRKNKHREYMLPEYNALTVLRERFARGEISEDEYKTKKNVLKEE